MAPGLELSPLLRKGFALTAAVNLVIGALFLVGPELDVSLWPSPISPVLTRFIGAIIMANGVGAWMVSRAGTWAEARALTFVGIVYGYLVLASVIPQLAFSDVDRSPWGYVVFTLVFYRSAYLHRLPVRDRAAAIERLDGEIRGPAGGCVHLRSVRSL